MIDPMAADELCSERFLVRRPLLECLVDLVLAETGRGSLPRGRSVAAGPAVAAAGQPGAEM